MKKLIYLFLALLIVACSSDDSGSNDSTAPIITLNGQAIVNVNPYSTYTDAGATATDEVDGDLTSSIVTSGVVNTSIEGSYTITYTVSDTSGNTATATRQVVVQNLTIGQSYQGGKIAYIDSTGQHGLIAATQDQGEDIQWYNASSLTGATGTAIGTGFANTNAIIAAQSSGSYAANIARDYNGGGYTDWFLPSTDELNELYAHQYAIGGFVDAYYWSSNEFDINDAVIQRFGNGAFYRYNKSNTAIVRAVRAF